MEPRGGSQACNGKKPDRFSPIVKNRTNNFSLHEPVLERQTGVASFCAMIKFTPVSEWSAPPVRLEDFVLGATWQQLPFDIKVALAHIWLREQETDKLSARLLWTTEDVSRAGASANGGAPIANHTDAQS